MDKDLESIQSTEADPLHDFYLALERVVSKPGLEVEIAYRANDTLGGYTRLHSVLTPCVDKNKLEVSLKDFFEKLLPNRENRQSFETTFNELSDKINQESHTDIANSEWQTVFNGVVLGIRTMWDGNVEIGKAFYLRNTTKKPSLISSLLRR